MRDLKVITIITGGPGTGETTLGSEKKTWK